MQKRELEKGDVIQIDPDHDEVFGGHLMVVTEPKEWGAQGYCPVFPHDGEKGGLAYYRCKFENMAFVGRALWMSE